MGNSNIYETKFKTRILTPELAAEWLDTMPEYQRKPSAVVVAEYAKDMAEGRWVNGTGDTIRFNKRGQMIDGQHRCLAVIESGTPILATVVGGLDDAVYAVLDKGKKRSASDTIGGKNATSRAAIAKTLIALSNGIPLASVLGSNTSKKYNPISQVEVAEVAMENDGLISRIYDCLAYLKSANNGRFSAAVATCLVAYAYEQGGNVESFYAFCKDLNKPVQERPTVCTMAREKAASFNVTSGKSKFAIIFAVFAIAYGHWMKGTTPKIIQPSTLTRDVSAIAVRRDWELRKQVTHDAH